MVELTITSTINVTCLCQMALPGEEEMQGTYNIYFLVKQKNKVLGLTAEQLRLFMNLKNFSPRNLISENFLEKLRICYLLNRQRSQINLYNFDMFGKISVGCFCLPFYQQISESGGGFTPLSIVHRSFCLSFCWQISES